MVQLRQLLFKTLVGLSMKYDTSHLNIQISIQLKMNVVKYDTNKFKDQTFRFCRFSSSRSCLIISCRICSSVI